jgi:hypothetical protein
MSNKLINQNSFINLFPEIVDDNNNKILDIWNSFSLRVLPDSFSRDAFIEYTPVSTDNLPLLAYKFYGNTKLWWVIPLINDVEDPFDFLQNIVSVGGTIKILKSDYISSIIFNTSRLKNAKDNN